ncbi:MAG: nodulation protein NfeD, partial [Cytophagales bacterium]|nr:nodulation protein NfeD [Cytophagales bacterium]
PGFGVAGILGITLTIGSLVLVMINNDNFDFSLVPFANILSAVMVVFAGMLGSVGIFIVAGAKLSTTRAFSRFTLTDTMDRESGYTSNFKKESLLGKLGTAYTILRPSGKVMIDGKIYDAYTRGEFINKDQKVIVTSEEGTSLKVKLEE